MSLRRLALIFPREAVFTRISALSGIVNQHHHQTVFNTLQRIPFSKKADSAGCDKKSAKQQAKQQGKKQAKQQGKKQAKQQRGDLKKKCADLAKKEKKASEKQKCADLLKKPSDQEKH